MSRRELKKLHLSPNNSHKNVKRHIFHDTNPIRSLRFRNNNKIGTRNMYRIINKLKIIILPLVILESHLLREIFGQICTVLRLHFEKNDDRFAVHQPHDTKSTISSLVSHKFFLPSFPKMKKINE